MSVEFVDTNVLVYAHDTSAGNKRLRAVELVLRLGRSGTGCVSVQVLMELAATLTRKIDPPLAAGTAAEIVDDLSTWAVHEPRASDVGEALRIAERHTISIWDAMIVQAAAAVKADVLWTEDFNHGQTYEGVPVRNPFRDD
jgi:predicted nucleic acid-binding protein